MESLATDKWVCVRCRKCFKQKMGREALACPQCGAFMTNAGKKLKVPSQNDLKQWKKIELLLQAGYRFPSSHGNTRPKRLREVPEFLAEEKRVAEVHQRAWLTEERASELKAQRNRRKKVRACKQELRTLRNQD
jgi:hypothetical protein